jgi:hypothetical protein
MGRLERQATSWLRQGPCEGERSQVTMLESEVRRKAPASFGAGERLQSPIDRYLQKPPAIGHRSCVSQQT